MNKHTRSPVHCPSEYVSQAAQNDSFVWYKVSFHWSHPPPLTPAGARRVTVALGPAARGQGVNVAPLRPPK